MQVFSSAALYRPRPLWRLFVALLIAGYAVVSFADLSHAASVTPEPIDETRAQSCSSFAGTEQDWIGLKVEPNADGTYTDGTLSVTIANTTDDKNFDWSSNIGVDAVYVKGGTAGSYLYRYDPPLESTSDTHLTSPGAGTSNSISHLVFCYDIDPVEPPVVIPEAPFAVLFPLAGLLVVAAGYLVWLRREQHGQVG